MFRSRRIRRLEEIVYSLSECEKALTELVNSGNEIPFYYIDSLLKTKKKRAIFQKRLETLKDDNNA